jgi:hypothetical protein
MTNSQAIIEAYLVTAQESLDTIADILADEPAAHILKAVKGNDRFKDTSTWVSLPNGKYQHLQSGKITSASRLSGYTEVAYTF